MLSFQEYSEKMAEVLEGLKMLEARSTALDQQTLRLEEKITSGDQEAALRKKIQEA